MKVFFHAVGKTVIMLKKKYCCFINGGTNLNWKRDTGHLFCFVVIFSLIYEVLVLSWFWPPNVSILPWSQCSILENTLWPKLLLVSSVWSALQYTNGKHPHVYNCNCMKDLTPSIPAILRRSTQDWSLSQDHFLRVEVTPSHFRL